MLVAAVVVQDQAIPLAPLHGEQRLVSGHDFPLMVQRL
jgi:hypothetical protein